MIVSRMATQFQGVRYGRHAIGRAGTIRDALHLCRARKTLPQGVHRTRVSQVRALRVCATALVARRHPIRTRERIPAVRLPMSPG